VEELLRSRFQDPPTLAELARGAGVHSVHLATAFRRHLGCTPGEYVRRCRVEFACRRLVTGTPLAELALDAGFAHQSHFCRVFKTVTGMTPTVYRQLFTSRA
jgi:AraC-like DNA-binding protein